MKEGNVEKENFDLLDE
jgi:hypothetical protein